MQPRNKVFGLALLALLGASTNCSQVVGIEDATCNPTLAECQAGTRGKTGAALCQEYCQHRHAELHGRLSSVRGAGNLSFGVQALARR